MVSKIIRILKYSGLGLVGLFILLGIIGATSVPDDTEEVLEIQPVVTQEEIIEETKPEIIVQEKAVIEPIKEEQKPVVKKEPTPTPVVVPVTQKEPDPVTEPVVVEEEFEQDTEPTGPRYYTSTHHSAKYYYPEDCREWEDLSKSYLRSFNSFEAFKSSSYGSRRTLSPEC